MSYNVTGFAIKKLDNFTLPYAKVLEMSEGISVTNIEEDGNDGTTTFDDFPVEGMEIVGTLDGERLNVTDISYRGEYSGTYWDEFEELLTQSIGTLKARIVWEGGDTVEVVTIANGVVTRKKL